MARALPAVLALIALVADLSGSHTVALVFVLAAIPAAFALTLAWYGDKVEARCGGVRPTFAAFGLTLLVLSAALRSPAVVGGVPRLAVSAIVLCLLFYAGAVVAAVLTPQPARVRVRPAAAEEERLAA